MTDNMIIDIPELRLPRDMAWRIKFIEAVEDHARRLGISGRFKVPRFFGYYYTGQRAVVVAGLWTVLVDDAELLRRLRHTVEKITDRRFNIASATEGGEPEFMLVNDSHDGSCWLWDYEHGRRFLEASDPVIFGQLDEYPAEDDAGQGPRYLGP
ncbi:hypothetical protein Verru16b_00502 [Lacunisphaera limnophila]|uniref:Uncharacterized protein n=1 Tax=Lacunisphaera limnophila TaxID=1838286 RepID=A0A1D8ARF0_9BACT|nr:hypothetical protein [Lacunisphaera limnophila]AOS43457.1 hypothetical protein Verru16b_00502 [Lacunisphaera limnophila]